MSASGAWIVVAALVLAACGTSTSRGSGLIQVVAGESFWGSIATQLGGSKVEVQSVVSDPNADPHEYQSGTGDARAVADADLVVLNGVGYDDWGQKLLAAGSSRHRQVLDVGRLLGRKAGDNPHFWYDPAAVVKVADAVTARYESIDATDASYFVQRRSDFTTALKPYLDEIAAIKQRYSGTAIGATESVFGYMAAALGLDLISPRAFMDAVSQGNDPPVSAVATFHDQVAGNRIKVLVYNVQTATAVTTNLKALAAAHLIPTVGVSETLRPPGITFQDWQVAQLRNLEGALSRAG